MIDIVGVVQGDLSFSDTSVPRGTNLLSIQQGNLLFNPDWGIDLEFYLSEKFQIQNESFKAYLQQRLSQEGIGVSEMSDQVENLYSIYTIGLADNSGTQFVR